VAPSATRPRAFVVEDEPLVRRVMREALESDGYEVGETSFGRGAEERVREFAPDVVILDLNLPDARGTDVLQRVRAIPETAKIPVVAFTGQYRDLSDAREALPGFDGHVLKPMNLVDLLRLLRALRARAREGGKPPPA
jgi:two-component system KDP operon response regulator KdpE